MLEVARAAEIHDIAGSRRLVAGERVEIPALSAAALEAPLQGSDPSM